MKSKHKYDILCGLFIVLSGILLWWRVRYGGLIADESLTWVQTGRFLAGDLPFRHEWNLSLLSGVLLVPVHWLMTLMGLQEDAFLLFTRRFFVVAWMIYIAFTYVRWRRIDALGAFLGCLLLFFLPPRYVFSFSYNSISFMGLLLATTLYATNTTRKASDYFWVGVSFAIGVIGCPYLIVLYPLYAIYGLLKEKKVFYMITLGAVLVGVCFSAVLFAMVNPKEILDAVPYMTMPNPERLHHTWLSFPVYTVKVFLRCFGNVYLGALYFALLVVSFFDRGNESRKHIWILLFAGMTLISIAHYCAQENANSLNTLLFRLPAFAVVVVLLVGDCEVRRLACATLLPSVIYALTYNLASNTGRLAVATAIGTSMLGSMVCLILAWRKIALDGALRRALSISIFSVFGGCLLAAGVVAPIRQWPHNAQADHGGPLDGLYTQAQYSRMEQTIYKEIKTYVDPDAGRSVLYFSHYLQWPYLASGKRIGAYSAWLSTLGPETLEKLKAFWTLNPDRIPDIIYVPGEDEKNFGELLRSCIVEYDYSYRMLPSGAVLYRRALRH